VGWIAIIPWCCDLAVAAVVIAIADEKITVSLQRRALPAHSTIELVRFLIIMEVLNGNTQVHGGAKVLVRELIHQISFWLQKLIVSVCGRFGVTYRMLCGYEDVVD